MLIKKKKIHQSEPFNASTISCVGYGPSCRLGDIGGKAGFVEENTERLRLEPHLEKVGFLNVSRMATAIGLCRL